MIFPKNCKPAQTGAQMQHLKRRKRASISVCVRERKQWCNRWATTSQERIERPREWARTERKKM